MVHARSARPPAFRPDLVQLLTFALILLAWLAGGASRGDVMGQVVFRAGCWAILTAAILAGPRPVLGDLRPVAALLAGIAVLPLLQLIPLPPAMWQSLPGRSALLVPGEPEGWRPWSMTPALTRNALASLIGPAVLLLLLAQGGARLRSRLSTALLTAVTAGVLIGLLQFSGVRFNNPFLNDTPGQISGIFANRNHFALFIAIGCALAPVWAFEDREALRWRGPLAGGLLLLFVLAILATGSRSGVLAAALAILAAAALVGGRLRRRMRHLPRWVFPALIAAALVVGGTFVALSVAADRAASIDRFLTLESGADMRTRALPTVLAMVTGYLPLGTGFGGFEPLFRMHEPDALLKLTYFNQAHNDFLGIAIDGGVPAILLLVAAILWWAFASVRAWRAEGGGEVLLARLGSAIIGIVLVASITDYPARTPIVMLVLTIAAAWLACGSGHSRGDALPPASQRL